MSNHQAIRLSKWEFFLHRLYRDLGYRDTVAKSLDHPELLDQYLNSDKWALTADHLKLHDYSTREIDEWSGCKLVYLNNDPILLPPGGSIEYLRLLGFGQEVYRY